MRSLIARIERYRGDAWERRSHSQMNIQLLIPFPKNNDTDPNPGI
ncbi:hypothetical protein [Dendronalium sp. ChiSLP03b]|nr:hypothetical protein [Dendronalium sp. ChiSLP03b]MDZ8204683.1 hypothetical protein [Dendronalium sp. ChiSLP03b]